MKNQKQLIDRAEVDRRASAGCTRHGEALMECHHDEPCERLKCSVCGGIRRQKSKPRKRQKGTTMCNTCIHKPVCSKYIATGGVNNCEHHKEERRGRWEYHWLDAYCSECGYENKPNAVTRVRDDPAFCPRCGADMKGNNDGKTK